MKYKLTARVVGLLMLEGPKQRLAAERDDLVFELVSDERSRVVEVSVTAAVPLEKAAALGAAVRPMPAGSKVQHHVVLNDDPALAERLTGELQRLETHLGFIFESQPLERVLWHEASRSLIPETSEEAQRIQFWDLSEKRGSVRGPAVRACRKFCVWGIA